LYIHRIIKSYLHHEQKKVYYSEKVSEIAYHSSEMERNAVEAERASVDQKISEFMAKHIGDSFDGIISGIFHAGIFVRLESTVEGMIAFRSMDDYYEFDERKLEARGKTGGKTYRIGQHVRVTVTAADPLLRRVDFSIERSEHSAGTAEKTTSAKNGRGRGTDRNRKKGRRKRK
jgi:ribonuclease R